MARWRKVYVRMWGDRKIRALSWPREPNGLTLFQRLLTGPETHSIPGLVLATEEQLASGLRWDLEGFRKAFREVLDQKLAVVDWEAGMVWLPNGARHNPPQSPNVVKSWVKSWDDLPDSHLKDEIYQELLAFLEGMGEAYAKPFRRLSGSKKHGVDRGLNHPSGNQEQEQEQEQEQDPPNPPKGGAKRGGRGQWKPTQDEQAHMASLFAHCEVVLLRDHAIKRRIGVTKTNGLEVLKRLREGVPVERLMAAFEARSQEAKRNPKMLEYLDTVTPFRDSNFGRSEALIDSARATRSSAVGHHQHTGDEEYPPAGVVEV